MKGVIGWKQMNVKNDFECCSLQFTIQTEKKYKFHNSTHFHDDLFNWYIIKYVYCHQMYL